MSNNFSQHISDDFILNSALFSAMSYKIYQYIYNGYSLQSKLLNKDKFENYFIENNIETFNTKQDIKLHLYVLFNSFTKSDEYTSLYEQKVLFYNRFKDKLNLKTSSEEDIRKIALRDCHTETKQMILRRFIESSNNNDLLKQVYDELKNHQTQIKNLEAENEKLSILNEDFLSLWNKFSPLNEEEYSSILNQDINTEDGVELKSFFGSGYLEIGNDFAKDSCILIGYMEIDGKQHLTITFRGTESNSKSLLNYGLEEYLNMNRHYKQIKPYLNKIIQQESHKWRLEHPEENLSILMCGHSLGASMSAFAYNDFKELDHIEIKKVSLAQPGFIHRLQKSVDFLDKYEKNLKHRYEMYDRLSQNNKFTKFIKIFVSAAFRSLETESLATKTSLHVLSAAVALFDGTKFLFLKIKNIRSNFEKNLDNPLFRKTYSSITINHSLDLIPLIGKILFKDQEKNTVYIKSNKSISFTEIVKNLFFSHSISNYYYEIKAQTQSQNNNPNLYDKNTSLSKIQAIRNTSSANSGHLSFKK